MQTVHYTTYQEGQYRACQWKRSHLNYPPLPPATEHECGMNGYVMELVWSEGPILPGRLVYINDECGDSASDSYDDDDDGGDNERESSDISDMDYSSDEYSSD